MEKSRRTPPVPSARRRLARVGAVCALALVAAACGSDDDGGTSNDDPTASSSVDSQRAASIEAIASFYPLEFVVGRVGGPHVAVNNLTPVGAEAHDLELSPRDTASLQDADLVVYLSGFVPALDDALDGIDAGQRFDVAPSARLDLTGAGHDHGDDDHDHADEEHADGSVAEDDHDHADDDHDHADDDHDHGGEDGAVDPHFWLDPRRLADVADAVAARLAELDPANAAEFEANAATLRAELEELDEQFESGLATCASDDLVTSHTAFAYLAARYGFDQVGISGLSPDQEPSPAQLAEVTDFVRDNDVSTIYYETLVDPSVAETVARETGATTAVLDPLEGLTEQSEGSDYLEVMAANLEALRAGQNCP